MKIKLLLTLFCIACLGLAAEPKQTPTLAPIAGQIQSGGLGYSRIEDTPEFKKLTDELATTKATLTTTQQALSAIQQQRNQAATSLLDAQANIAILQEMLKNANAELAELNKKAEPSPTPIPMPAK